MTKAQKTFEKLAEGEMTGALIGGGAAGAGGYLYGKAKGAQAVTSKLKSAGKWGGLLAAAAGGLGLLAKSKAGKEGLKGVSKSVKNMFKNKPPAQKATRFNSGTSTKAPFTGSKARGGSSSKPNVKPRNKRTNRNFGGGYRVGL